MKKNFLTILFVLALCSSTFAQWKPAGDKIKTSWGEQLDPKNVLPEYPRPIMERSDWKNLNGLWKYAITPKGTPAPAAYQGDILVPFAVESSLSGVGKMINEKEELWYQRTFDVPSAWRGKQILLHFGAVDWKAEVWVNDVKVGEHTGGFTPFYFDITSVLNKGNNDLVVKVWDPSDRGEQPRGKQIANPHGIWYTPVTGIWQTVWLEPVATQYITNLKTTPDIDNNSVKVEVAANTTSADKVEVKVFDDYVQPNNVVESGEFDANYFQHVPYLEQFNEEKGTHLVVAGKIHYEPFGIYPGTKKDLKDIAKGDKIAVPNDTTNEARALLLLQDNGIIKLKDGAGIKATVNDIEENPNNIEIVELEAAQVPRVVNEVAYVVLNGNYALEANYTVKKDALAYEKSDSEAAKTYVNVIAVKEGNENSEKIKALVDVLKSDSIKKFINEKYDGAVIVYDGE